jgi:hypothetical protein
MMGTVHAINPARRMVAIATSDGFTVVELLRDGDVEIGDELAWQDYTALGSQVYANRTKHTQVRVSVRSHHVSEDQLQQLLLD